MNIKTKKLGYFHQSLSIVIGLCALALGISYYWVFRPETMPALLRWILPTPHDGVSVFMFFSTDYLRWFPSFIHTFAFSIFTGLVLGRRYFLPACAFWVLINSLLEVAGLFPETVLPFLPDLSMLVSMPALSLHSYAANQTFDSADIIAGVSGGIVALLVLKRIFLRRDQVIPQEWCHASTYLDCVGLKQKSNIVKPLWILIIIWIGLVGITGCGGGSTPTPTPQSKEIVVVIDPGHGGSDTGFERPYFSNGIRMILSRVFLPTSGVLECYDPPFIMNSDDFCYEKNLNLELAKKLKIYLEQGGKIKVLMTRTGDYYVEDGGCTDLPGSYESQRAKFFRLETDSDAFISIHHPPSRREAYSTDEASTTVAYTGDGSMANKIANALGKKYNAIYGPYRMIELVPLGLAESRRECSSSFPSWGPTTLIEAAEGTTRSAVMIEPAWVNDSGDRDHGIVFAIEKMDLTAQGIAQGIKDHLKVNDASPSVSPLALPMEAPTAVFSLEKGNQSLDIKFINKSYGVVETIVLDFGDGAPNNDFVDHHTYSQPGTYTVSLTLTGPGGSDTTTHQIKVEADQFTKICDYAILQEALAQSRSVKFDCEGPIVVTPELDINQDTVLDATGHNVTLSGNGNNRVLKVRPGIKLELKDITIANGSADHGGGIDNEGTVTLTNVILRDHTVTSGGGAIFNYSTGTVTLNNSTVTGNKAVSGAGIDNAFGKVSINDSTLTNNTATGGGSLRNYEGTMTLNRSTVSANSADFGGAIDNLGTLTLENSTVSGNTGKYGGALRNYTTGTILLTHSTLANNSATLSGGGIDNLGTVNLNRSLIANNTSRNCAGSGYSDQGYNLASDSSCGLTQPTSLSSTDPLLTPLADNSGPTQTHALLAGSPAIDTIPVAADGACTVAQDQRSMRRPQDGDGDSIAACDIGAVEQCLGMCQP